MRNSDGRPFAKGNKVGGTRKGIPNKATVEARKAIADFVDGNAHRLQKWLDQVADGIKVTEQNAKGEDVDRYIVPPNAERAFMLFQTVIEYHVPKLARTEVTGAGGGPVVISATETDKRL